MIKTGLMKGFTLAEVLTTLMVIGVVAAMTIPTLINSTDDQQHKTALKKAISILSQAAQLNIAKEVECDIVSSEKLCECFQHSMQGSCTATTVGNNNVAVDMTTAPYTLTTPDGISYSFFYRGKAAKKNPEDDGVKKDATSFKQICGTKVPNSEEKWKGQGYRCVVIVDTNGLNKGTRTLSANEDYYGSGKSATSLNTISSDDQFPLIITAAGIYPAITEVKKRYGHLGYSYMYGSGTNIKPPFTQYKEVDDPENPGEKIQQALDDKDQVFGDLY